MYLHLGGQVTVPACSVVGIFDLDNATVSKHTRAFLAAAQDENIVINVSEDLPRSFVICMEDNKTHVYISQISPQTLLKRAETNNFADL